MMNDSVSPAPRWPSLLAFLLLLSPLAQAQHLKVSAEDRNRLKEETMYSIDLIQTYHYTQKRFKDLDARELLVNYMRDIDGARLFFLEEDKDFILQRFEHTLKPTYLSTGDLFPAFEIFNVYLDRVHDRLDWVEARLEGDFAFDSASVYRPDRREADWPADEEDADGLWERRLTFELIAELLEDEPMESARERVGRRYDRMRRHFEGFEIHNVQEVFLTALAQLYDPHTTFFSWESAREFDIQIRNSLVGIGAHLRDIDGYCVIERLLPGGPAEASAEIHPGDRIVAVGQGIDGEMVDTIGMRLRRVVQMIRGEPGTTVRLTVLPADSGRRHEVVLERERIELTANLASAQVYELPGDDDSTTSIGLIKLNSFYGEEIGATAGTKTSTSRDVKELIERLKEHDIQGIVLDLRENGGGRLDEAVALTGLFIDEGPVVIKRSFRGELEEDLDKDPSIAWDGPLVVLVSRQSASASEIVAGALQSYNRAIVVGDASTHGKGTVQAPIDLREAMRRSPFSSIPQVGMVKITIQKFYLPDGASTQNRGVPSDIALPSVADILVEGESDLKNALEWDQIEPLSFQAPTDPAWRDVFVSEALIDELRHRSEERRSKLEEFDFLDRNLSWFRDRYERKEHSLNLEVRRAERLAEQERRKAFEQERRRLGRDPIPSTRIELALSAEKRADHQAKLRDNPLPDGASRANRYYQRVFYYELTQGGEIKEIWVEHFDYHEALSHSEKLAQVISAELDTEVTPEEMESILTTLRNADPGAEFNPVEPFEHMLGTRTDREAIEAALPGFFTALIEIDDTVLRDSAILDVPLRESLRIIDDWIGLTRDPKAFAALAKAERSGDQGTPAP